MTRLMRRQHRCHRPCQHGRKQREKTDEGKWLATGHADMVEVPVMPDGLDGREGNVDPKHDAKGNLQPGATCVGSVILGSED